MIVYKATNKTNGKCYVGITTQSLTQRKREHLSRLRSGLRSHKFYLALGKYGVDNFTWQCLEHCDNVTQLTEREQYYISLFNSYKRGYNSTPGGDIVSDETKIIISAKLTGRIITWGWKTRETRLANGSYFGYAKPKGDHSSLSKSYVITSPVGEVFFVKGLNQFCKNNGLTMCLMIQVANGAQTHHKGYKCVRLEEPSTTRPTGRTSKWGEMGNISMEMKI